MAIHLAYYPELSSLFHQCCKTCSSCTKSRPDTATKGKLTKFLSRKFKILKIRKNMKFVKNIEIFRYKWVCKSSRDMTQTYTLNWVDVPKIVVAETWSIPPSSSPHLFLQLTLSQLTARLVGLVRKEQFKTMNFRL